MRFFKFPGLKMQITAMRHISLAVNGIASVCANRSYPNLFIIYLFKKYFF